MLLTLSEVSALKAAMAEKGIAVHFHNTCGSQYFTLDEPGEAVKAAIEDYFADRPRAPPGLHDDGQGFYVPDRLAP